MYGIKYYGKHSYNDMEYTMPAEKEIGFPSKEKIIVKVPFSNTEYDFSQIYGSQTYTSRTLKYTFNVLKRGNWTPQALQIEKIKLINWLMNSHGKQRLYDDDIPGYYFIAEVESEANFVDDYETGSLTVTFRAYPFMIAELVEGNDIWDTFNFELDVSQQVDFEVDGQLDITLYNVGTPNVTPTITASSAMTIQKGSTTFNVPSGESKSSDFYLASGENDLIITGNGTIKFTFYKELI